MKENDFMKIQPYLFFQGNCREAVTFYEEVFRTEPAKIMTFGEMPPDPGFPMPEEIKELVANTSLYIKDTTIMFSDVPAGVPFRVGTNMSILVISESLDDLKSYFEKLKEGGTVEMELQETFWSKAYGSLVDKFGIPWQFDFDETIN
jgi:PhnB protein